ncbi:shikimate dehydrogenase family protein [Sediminitomix flava]|uniref:Shikimate dehydrogenase n=1 Tax=Sediminitomix flava TaxID=379075 RepID=A0A315ZCQ4_SEDFL|nr:shikimate dehydrogenase [Sediminitomix flava]PWJ43365.1 shikimate dehydrogenase [Sediminitomix flava]
MKKYGLIGYPLTHSFSKKYFADKYERENITDAQYELYELAQIEEFKDLISENNFSGLNVTIPYKEQVIQFLDKLDPQTAERIGAVNVIKFEENGQKVGYNSDYIGFARSLDKFLPHHNMKALILGTGGASKAIRAVLDDRNIPHKYVSRNAGEDILSYDQLSEELMGEYHLIINTTPLGTYPKEDTFPNIPYEYLTEDHYLMDLVYNPEVTLFMQKGLDKGAKAKNGHEMLIGQAEGAWEIWNQ